MLNRLILICCIYCSSISGLLAQEDIVAMEYYIDTDPGQGLGTSIPITTGQDIDINFTVPTSSLGLANGTHVLVIRAQQATGEWGVYESRLFYIQANVPAQPPKADIDMVEYFIDVDPGLGSGTMVSITSGADVDLTQLVSSGTLTEGFHNISYRARNTNGQWGFYENRIFYIQPPVNNNPNPPDITEMEYYFDNDPGQGNGTSFTITAGTVVDIAELLIPNSLSEGIHLIGIRAKNADDEWGFAETRKIYVNPAGVAEPTPAEITKLEYFYNESDPGLGSATEISVDPDATEVDIASILLPTEETIPIGTNTITVRALNTNGLWSFSETREFEVADDCAQPTAAFTPELACAGQMINFIDNSTDVQPDATYRWYFDGNDTPDSFATGSTSWTFDNPGTYTVALAISQGQICYDSIFMDIEVKPQPFVVFNTNTVEVGNPTLYTVDQFNVDPGAVWEWDFETDGTIDDNTVGNNSFTFSAAGTYNTTLTVTDGLGCGTTFSRSVTVSSTSTGGGGTPEADFQATTVCLGESTQFNDLSTNLPTGSSYSWDFDNDGTEDSATAGSVQFTYPTSGSFTATLTVDTGSGLLTHSEIVNVVAFPNADFSVAEACVTSTVNFTDLTTDASTGATYSWDFDGDGTEDSATAGDVSFTYTAGGTYSVVLLVNNGSGCFDTRVQQVNVIPEPVADFTISAGCQGESTLFTNNSSDLGSSVTYAWDIDNDGTVESTTEDFEFTFTSAGTFDIRLAVDNGLGCIGEVVQQVTISAFPEANFNVISGCVGDPVLFVDQSLNLEPGVTYSWDFDNDGTVDSTTPGDVSFTYGTGNSFTAKLTIDNGGCQDELLVPVTFDAAALPDFNATEVCIGDATVFTDLTTNTSLGATYSWDFDGDGTEDDDVPGSTSFIFDDPGVYTTRLTIDNNGCITFEEQQVTVNALPITSLGTDIDICADQTLTLDPGPGFTDYLWSDGSVNQTLDVTEAGTYSVEVTDENGCTATDEITVTESPLTVADFSYTIEILELSAIVRFTNLSEVADSYQWDFGNGGSSTAENPEYEFTNIDVFSGTVFEICLTTTNSCNEDQICQLIPLTVTGGVQEIPTGISFYPNPGSGDVYMQSSIPGNYEVNLFDFTGRLQEQKQLTMTPSSNQQLLFSNLKRGGYLLKIKTDEGVFDQKIMVK